MFNLKSTLCRICLESIGQSKGFNIFITDDLAKKLMSCTGQPVEPTDEHPDHLCQKCYENLLKFYEFQQMCYKSLNKFLELIKTSERGEPNDDAGVNLKGALDRHTVLTESGTEQGNNSQTFSKAQQNSKRSSRLKRKLQNQRQEKPLGPKRSCKNPLQKICKSGPSKDQTENDLKEYLQFGKDENKIIENIAQDLVSQKPLEKQNEANSFLPDDQEREKINEQEEIVQRQIEEILLAEAQELKEGAERPFPKKPQHQCRCCRLKFKTIFKLQVHLRQHMGLPPYLCSFKGCTCSFDHWQSYKNHLKDHNSREQIFECDVDNCERVYKTKSNLNIHKRKFHNLGPQLKLHMCEICGKVFKSSAVLNDHQFTHIDKTQLPYACEEKDCHKRFSTKEKLKIHKMRHAGIKNFVCPHCGMRKTTRNELKIHINYHTLEKTWSCRFCPKVCNSAGNLKMHIKNIHEGAKDFACRFCQRTFAKADTKKYHEMTHTGEKPNECKECGRRFVQPAALRTHRKIHLRQKEKLINEKYNEEEDEKCISGNIDDEANFLTESIVVEILNDATTS